MNLFKTICSLYDHASSVTRAVFRSQFLFPQILIGTSLLFVYFCNRSSKSLPGPAKIPFFGNIFQISSKETWRWFEHVFRRYGTVISVQVMNDNLLILSDPKDAEELLGARAANYSSRKRLPYAGTYRSGNRRMLLLPFGHEFKQQRAAMRYLFSAHQPVYNRQRQLLQCKKLLAELLTNVDDYAACFKRFSSGIVLGICYGMSLQEAEDQFPSVLENNESMGSDLIFGAQLVDTFPWLDCLPDVVFPWRKEARRKHAEEVKLFSRWADVARQHSGSSLIGQLLNDQTTLDLDYESIIYIGGSFIEAGTNTTSCLLHCFILGCVSNPTVLSRAHEEFSRVLCGRPPSWDDFHHLPYLFATVKECLRWCPVTPLAFPHLAANDDTWKGYHISAGTLVVASIWNMHRNPDVFENPSVFDPDRFFQCTEEGGLPKDSSLAEGLWTFGFGRRACPGRQLALDSIWLAIANILWAFELRPHDNAPLPANLDDMLTWRDSVNIEPRSLPVSFIPRSADTVEIIKSNWADAQLLH